MFGRRLVSTLGAAILTLLATACAPDHGPTKHANRDPTAAAAASRSARPPFLRVSGGPGATIDVMGTIHLGPAEGWELSPEVESALAGADRFVLELDLDALDEDAVGSALAEMVILPPGTTLQDVVSPETDALLEEHDALLARYGQPRNARVRMKPWYIALGLVQIAADQAGYEMGRSADQLILERRGERPLLGLETFETQLRLMDALDPVVQDAMLRDTLMRLEDAGAELERLVVAWRRADRAELFALAHQGVDELPALERFYEALLEERNARWVSRLRPLLDDPARAGERVFMGAGALHLVGPDGLEQMFRDAGYDVARIH